MTYAEEQAANAEQAKTQVLGLVPLLAAGQVSVEELAALTGTTIAAASGRAVVLADLGLAATLAAMTGTPVPHLGMVFPETERERVEQAVTTTLDGPDEDVPMRLGRLAKAEPMETGRRAFHEAMQANAVQGFTRKAQPDACALCKALADGSVIPIRRGVLLDHPGCNCVAVPVLKAEEDEVVFQTASRRFVTGHGTHRREYSSPIPGLTFITPRPSRGRVR